MKSIIKGKMYNTETATCVASYSDSLESDLYAIDETIYIKKTGEWFLNGYGGLITRYAIQSGDSWSCRRELIPLTDSEAKEWLSQHNFVDEYIKYFGEPEE